MEIPIEYLAMSNMSLQDVAHALYEPTREIHALVASSESRWGKVNQLRGTCSTDLLWGKVHELRRIYWDLLMFLLSPRIWPSNVSHMMTNSCTVLSVEALHTLLGLSTVCLELVVSLDCLGSDNSASSKTPEAEMLAVNMHLDRLGVSLRNTKAMIDLLQYLQILAFRLRTEWDVGR